MYINKETKETTTVVRVANTSLPKVLSDELLDSLGYARVKATLAPTELHGRAVTKGGITEVNGVYTQEWAVDDSNLNVMAGLRQGRNDLLTRCDYTQATDTTQTVTDKAAWATYRQELRDLPANTPDPENIVWPNSPSSITEGI